MNSLAKPTNHPARAGAGHYAALFAALLAAFGLRLYHLDFRALWFDEGLSLLFARLGYAEGARMAVTLADTNPPIYRLMLGVWINAVGSAAWTTRLFSALPGLALVAVVYALARQLGLARGAALAAAWLAAASPMLVYYSQEAKGYSWVTLGAVTSVLLWLHAAGKPDLAGPRRAALWAVYGLCTLVAVGSHYIAAFLISVEVLWTAVLTWRGRAAERRRWLVFWGWMLAAGAAAALALLPFVVSTFLGTAAVVKGQTGAFDNLSTLPLLARLGLELTQGPGADGGGDWLIAAALAALAAWGLPAFNRSARWVVVSWFGLPLIMGAALNAYHEFFFPRFVAYTVPALLTAAAAGLWRLAGRVSFRPAAALALTAIVGLVWAPTLRRQYDAPTAPGEDWRPVAAAVRPLLRSGDAAVYVWGWIPGYLDAYLGAAPRPDYSLGFFTPESLGPSMQTITAGHSRLWLFDYEVDQFDVRNMAGTWLRPRAALVYEDWPGGGKGHAALFALQPTPSTSQAAVTHTFANGMRLTATELRAKARPGDALAMALTWTTGATQTESYTVFLHALAEDGTLAFSRDSEPGEGAAPVTGWKPGTSVNELRGLLIPPDAAPGAYTLSLGIYKTNGGEVDPAGPVTLGTVVVK